MISIKGIKVGDVVVRKSYKGDVLFRVAEIVKGEEGEFALLKGVFIRLCASAPLSDLEKKGVAEIIRQQSAFKKKKQQYIRVALSRQGRLREYNLQRGGRKGKYDFFELPGRVLHLDGDPQYCELCLKTYLRLGVPCRVLHVPEQEQPEAVRGYLQESMPDILVLTGHDAVKKGVRDYRKTDYYRNSQFFLAAVRRAREVEPDRDNLIIIAGGCQSHYEALIEAGANFASAPERVMIDVLDPVFIAERLAFTSIYEKVHLPDLLEQAALGVQSMGGIQTKGKLRLGLPRPRY
ncbi:sporulation peptidase YabG [Thermacetogenium phaeum]|uniref:sporulation peptidase YabG n=1 Tax=Thermacetogenium phaeum TaxID=85874 RepID=UPI0002EC31C7|nr:sporulation peptidase YabG [Thermacetogenium phaeum]